MSLSSPAPSERARVRRVPQRADYAPDTVLTIVRAARVCHVAFADAAGVHCIPTSCWVHGDALHIHGARAGRMIEALKTGEACVAVSHVDGLVFARSAMHHSMNYRSVVAYGRFEEVVDEAEKRASFETFIETLASGRWAEVRPPNAKEMAATSLLRLPLDEAAAKIRAGGPKDDEADMTLPVWAGVVPLGVRFDEPVAEAGCATMRAPRCETP